jgi:acyl phosphate:glycerol-3-phosphate acyltransferase
VDIVPHVVAAVAAYLLGSIPTGYLVGRAKGVDIRRVGSGNIGATNAFRILGKTAGTLVLLADAAKGFLACWFLSRLIAAHAPGAGENLAPTGESLAIVAGIAAILGHNYTCWLKFKGGKGVATTAGVLVALFPKAFLIGLGVWLAVLALSRYVSLASICAAVVLPLAVWFCGGSTTLIVVGALLGALAIYKHKSNLERLLHGTEHRLGRKPDQAKVEPKKT